MNLVPIMIAFIALWFLQIYLSSHQVKAYSNELSRMKRHKSGHLGVGIFRTKSVIGKGSVVILATNEAGEVLDASELQGRSFLAKFQSVGEWIGKSPCEVYAGLSAKNRKIAFEKAVELINIEREKGSLERLSLI